MEVPLALAAAQQAAGSFSVSASEEQVQAEYPLDVALDVDNTADEAAGAEVAELDAGVELVEPAREEVMMATHHQIAYASAYGLVQ